MSIFAFSELENGKVRRIFASAKYPSKQIGNVLFDSDLVPNLRFSDEIPLKLRCMHALVAFRPSYILLSRDVLGGRPLYYGDDLSFSSFKSYIGSNFKEVKPGEVIKINYGGEVIEKKIFKFDEVFSGESNEVEELIEKIKNSLLSFKYGNACIAFSGGIDSSFLASIYDVPLISVTANKKEEEWIKTAAKKIGREIEVKKIREEDIKNKIGEIKKIIETENYLQVSIAVPIFFVLSFAKEQGYSEIIFGQGADELFGGYKRYENATEEDLEMMLVEDVKSLGEKNLVRDIKLAYSNEIKLLTPYLSWDVIEAAVKIPAKYKVTKVDGKIVRKYILRKIAEEFIPKEIAWREKKAIQYSTGISRMLRKIL
ncbi:asparagine synthase [Archaeoglobales archaeon ex4484_92]|nr:MAG: asparagine synthase [Archaeoglobales archaeon ex4484_92]